MDKSRWSYRWMGAVAVGLLALALGGCGSSSSGGGDTAAAPPVAPVTPAVPSVAAPTGSAPITLTASTPAATFAALAPVVKVGGVSISSPACVSFSMADANNNAIIGFGSTSQSATATVASYPNLAFSLAKLVPGETTAGGTGPSKWVSYIVHGVPTKNATTGAITAAAPSRPGTDNTGTLTDNKNGTYTYCFYRDVTKVKDAVAGMTDPAGSSKADLGDLTYEPNLTHRLTIQISGNAPGTGTNTPNGVSTTAGVPMKNPLNVVYDFIPATGKEVTASDLRRFIVAKENCNECHSKLGGIPGTESESFHGGARYDPNYCVVCHTDQRKYGRSNVTSTAGKFPALTETKTVDPTTGITSYSYSPLTYVTDGETMGNFPRLIHRIHRGKDLVKENYNYAGLALNTLGYSMLGDGQKMCTKCHNSTRGAQADNFNKVPSRLACGACHDGINWATGGGSTMADKAAASAVGAVLATSGHIGKAQATDTNCNLCHSPADIKTYHQTDNLSKNNPTIPAGLKNFSYEIKSATVSAANDLAIVFRILADGTAVTLNTPASPAPSTSLTGFTGGPSFLIAWATDASGTDGTASPIDFNNTGKKGGTTDAQATSVSLASFMNSATSSLSLSARDADGYYTATIKSTNNAIPPVGAKMRTVVLQSYYTQVSPAAARHAISVARTVTGDTARRSVIDPAKCSNCHEWLELHGGSRVLAPESTATVVCVMCHNPNLATSGRGIPDATLNTWTFNAADQKVLDYWNFDKTKPNAALAFPVTSNNFKDMIHGIHSGRARVNPFMDTRDRTPNAIVVLDFARMNFPGILSNCETCHLSGSYNSVPANTLPSTYESIDAAYAATATPANAKASRLTVNTSDVVTSPFTAACVSCHDSAAAQAHFTITGGGKIKAARNTLSATSEQCAFCHGPGKIVDVTVVHKK